MASRNLLAHDLIVAISVGSAAVVVFVIILFVLWKFCLRKKAQQRQQQQQTSKSENKSFDQVKQHLLFTRQIVDYVEAVIGRLEIYYNCKI